MSKIPERQFVVCICNEGYPTTLELHKIYRVLPDAEAERQGDLRIVDESGEDYLLSGRLVRAHPGAHKTSGFPGKGFLADSPRLAVTRPLRHVDAIFPRVFWG